MTAPRPPQAGHPDYARRVATVKQSELRRLSALCAEMGGVNLSQGVCDQPTPDVLKAAAKRAIDDDHSIYTHLAGIRKLRDAIAEKMRSFNGIEADPETEIAVTVGSAGAFFCAAMATLEPGDEVVIFSPFYNYYTDALRLFDVKLNFVETRPPDWKYDSADLAAAFGERTRWVIVNTPCNPSGKVFSETELREIAALARRWNAWIVTDEIYEYITYGVPHLSIARLPDARGRTLTLSGASKTYAVTGWRVGYAVGPADLIRRMGVVGDLIYICAPSALQHGVSAGLGMPSSYYAEMAADYQRKRDLLVDTLQVLGWRPYIPAGSFYLMADFGDHFPDGLMAANQILERVGVATVPGSSFYRNPDDGRTQLRFCFAKKMPDLEEACRRLAKLRN